MDVLFLTSHRDGERARHILNTALDVLPYYRVRWQENIEGEFKDYPAEYDLGISFLYNYRVPAEQFKPNRVWINFHPAPLPEYRGRNVAYHAILNGEAEFGATIHYMDKDFDTGDIINVGHFPILDCFHAGDIAEMARELCLALFKRYIPIFLKGERPLGIKQGQGVYYHRFRIDPFVLLTEEQERLIRAITAPPHFAKTIIGGVEYVIHPASVVYHPDDEPTRPAETNPDPVVSIDPRD